MVQKKIVEPASEMSKPTVQMYLRTILLILSWLVMGICSEIIGPTMGILAHNTHVTYNGIASALASRSAAGLLTNIVCGIFQNFVNNYQDLMLTIGFLLPAILVSVTPFISSLLLMCMVFFVHGITASIANMGGTNLLFKMWDTRVAVPFNMVHLGYGFGAIFANLLVRPFLSNKNSYVNGTVSSQINSTLSTSISIPLNADIQVPYFITAGLCFLIGVGHFIFLIREQNNKQDKARKQQVDYAPVNTISSKIETHPNEIKFSDYSPAICGHGYFGYGLSLSIIFTVYIFFVAGTDQTFAKFYFSYLKFDKFGISTDGASSGIILFWLSFSMGRLIGAIESVFIPVYICLIVAWCGGLVLTVIWTVYVWILGLTATSLFVLGSLTGFIIAPLFPLSFAWITQKLKAIPPLLAALFCGGGLGSLVLQKIGGIVMDRDPNHFPTLITACVITTIILFILSSVIIFFHERRLKNKQHLVISDMPLITDKSSEEEQQMVNYLQGGNETQ